MARENQVAKARAFAAQSHADQLRGEHFYMDHLDEVAAMMVARGEHHQLLAYLLYISETAATGQIAAEFGDEIARQVALISDEPGDNKKQRGAFTNAKLAKADAVKDAAVLVVKLADRLCDVRRAYDDGDRGQLRKHRQAYGEFQRAVRRDGMADDLWEELNSYIRPG